MEKKNNKKKNPKRRCINCGKVMVQQFIGLKHCKCGTSWSKGQGYFERTLGMVFALERRVVKKSKNSIKTKQFPVIRYKNEVESATGAICKICKGNMEKVDGCKPSVFIHGGKRYERFTVGSAGDFYEDDGENALCTDCGAKHGHYHHDGCDCEVCPDAAGNCLLVAVMFALNIKNEFDNLHFVQEVFL